MADTTVVASVLTWLEAHDSVDGLPVTLEDIPADGINAVMLTSIPGDPYVKRYKSGGYMATYPFAVVLRLSQPDTSDRLTAMGVLGDLASSIDDRATWPSPPTGYDYDSLEVRTMPARVARGESGADDYQVTFTLTYRKRG